VPNLPDPQAFAADASKIADDAQHAYVGALSAGRGVRVSDSSLVSAEALAQAARANQSSFQRPGEDQFSRIERIRRQLSPRSFWPDRIR
jgi:hypothetical protein